MVLTQGKYSVTPMIFSTKKWNSIYDSFLVLNQSNSELKKPPLSFTICKPKLNHHLYNRYT